MTEEVRSDGGNSGLCEEIEGHFDALSHPIRRSILVLLKREDKMQIDDLVRDIDVPADVVEGDDLARVVRHQHVPSLEKHNLVEFDEERGIIEYNAGCLAEELLAVVDDYKNPQR